MKKGTKQDESRKSCTCQDREERKKEHQERDQIKGRTRKPKQNKENAAPSRSKMKKGLTKILKKKIRFGKFAIGKRYGGLSCSQAWETGLGTDKEREKKKRRYFTC